MGRICAWCGAVLRSRSHGETRVTHTICAGCFRDLEAAVVRSGLKLSGRPRA